MQSEVYAEAFESGYRSTRRMLLGRGALIEESEEIAQAAWVRGWEYRHQLRDPNLVAHWVNTIARNLFHERFRSPFTLPIDNVNPSYTMDLDSLEVRRLLDRCDTRERKLLEQSLEGYSSEEMARMAGITPTGIRVRLMRLRNNLRDQIESAA